MEDEKALLSVKKSFISHAWVRMLILAAVYFAYLVVGTIIFQVLEKGEEHNIEKPDEMLLLGQPSKSETTKKDPCEVYRNMMNVLYDYNYTDDRIKLAFGKGAEMSTFIVHKFGFIKDFAQTFLFVITISTTVGYGHVAPRSNLSKVFCIIYGLFGVPLHITLMRFIGAKFEVQLDRLIQHVKAKHQGINYAVTVFYVILLTIIFIVLPAVFFMFTEKWSFLTSVYYCWITLTTVGLGDYVAGSTLVNEHYYPVYVILLTVWTIFGLAYAFVLLRWLTSMMTGWVEKVFSLCQRRRQDSEDIIDMRKKNPPDELDKQLLCEELMGLTKDDHIEDSHIELIDSLIDHYENWWTRCWKQCPDDEH